MELNEPDVSYNNYTYADYLTWSMDKMVELIKGRVYKMSPAPKKIISLFHGVYQVYFIII